jgi:hypothetical protein
MRLGHVETKDPVKNRVFIKYTTGALTNLRQTLR